VDQYSDGLRKKLGHEVLKGSFDEAVKSIRRNTGGQIAKRQMAEISEKMVQDFDEFYEQRTLHPTAAASSILVMSTDGKGIVMHQKDLRAATKKAASKSQHKLQTRLSSGEKKNRKRMSTVATVYSVEPHPRTAESIMKLEQSEEVSPSPKAQDKRIWASVEKDPKEVTDDMFQEALRRDPQKKRQWAMLIDGDPGQIRRIRQYAEKHHMVVTMILDFIHVLEYLWKAAYCFYEPSTQEAEKWVQKRALEILKGNASRVAAGMRRSATWKQLKKKKRKAVDTCAQYLLKNRALLRYHDYLERGLPIATGVIEGACRHLVKDRMDLTGARWRLKSAESVLKLRALYSSGDLEEYWGFHKDKERQRNHLLRYAELPEKMAA